MVIVENNMDGKLYEVVCDECKSKNVYITDLEVEDGLECVEVVECCDCKHKFYVSSDDVEIYEVD